MVASEEIIANKEVLVLGCGEDVSERHMKDVEKDIRIIKRDKLPVSKTHQKNKKLKIESCDATKADNKISASLFVGGIEVVDSCCGDGGVDGGVVGLNGGVDGVVGGVVGMVGSVVVVVGCEEEEKKKMEGVDALLGLAEEVRVVL